MSLPGVVLCPSAAHCITAPNPEVGMAWEPWDGQESLLDLLCHLGPSSCTEIKVWALVFLSF